MPDDDSVFEFPCRFPIKVMGRDREGFLAHVINLIGLHTEEVSHENVAIRPSRNGNFISVTVTFTAESRAQLDRIYQSLTSSEQILFVI